MPSRLPSICIWSARISVVYFSTPSLSVHLRVRKLARGPPLWDDCGDAHVGASAAAEPDWDLPAQAAPDYEVDQRINW